MAGELGMAGRRRDDVGHPPHRRPQLAGAQVTHAEFVVALGLAVFDRLQHLAISPVLEPALPGRDNVVRALRADRGAAIALGLVDEDRLAPARLTVDQPVDRALAPPLEEGGFGPGGVLPGVAGNLLHNLDEIVMAAGDEARCGGLVDLGSRKGRVFPEIEKGSFDVFEKGSEVFAAEKSA